MLPQPRREMAAKAEGSGSWFFHESLDEGEGFEMKRLVEEAEAAAITEN